MNQGFVGRTQVLSSLINYIYDDQLPNRIALMSGIPGVGKTCLLEHLENFFGNTDLPFALTENAPSSIVHVMKEWVASLEKKGYKLKGFGKKYNRYLEIIAKIEKTPGLGELGSALLGKVTGKAIAQVGSLIPGGSVVVNTIGTDFIESQSNAFFAYLYAKLHNKEDVNLLLNPISTLSTYFVRDITATGKTGNLVLALDNFDPKDQVLLNWISDLAKGKFGEFDCKIIFILAAQKFEKHSLAKSNMHFKEFVVEPFDFEETKSYYLSMGGVNLDLLPALYERSGGLPLFLAIFTSFKNIAIDDVSPAIIKNLLNSITDANQKNILLHLSTALSFNKDVLASLFPKQNNEELSTTFDWVIELPFVNFSGGEWKFEHSIRRQLLSYFNNQSPKEYKTSNSILLNFYKERLLASRKFQNAPWENNEEWWRDYLSSSYHMLCSDSSGGTVFIYREFPALFFNTIYNSYKLTEWADVMIMAAKDMNIGGEFYDFLQAVKDEFGNFNIFDRMGIYTSRTRFIFDVVSRNCDDSVPSILRAWMYASKDVLLVRTNTPEQMVTTLTKAIDIEPSESQFYLMRSMIYVKQENFNEALMDLSTAIEINPDDMSNYYLHGVLSFRVGNIESAIMDFTNIINTTAAPLAFYFRAKIHNSQQQFNEAILDVTSAMDFSPKEKNVDSNGTNADINLNPNSIEDMLYNSLFSMKELHLIRGESFYHFGDYQKASLDLQEVLQEDPDNVLANYYQGVIEFSNENFGECIVSLERAINNGLEADKQINAHVVRGICLYETKQTSLALNALNSAIELDSNSAEARQTRAAILRELGDYAAAIADCSQILGGHPNDCDALFTRAKSLIAVKQYKQAVVDLNNIIRAVQGDHIKFDLDSVYFERGKALFEMQEYKSSSSDLLTAIDINPYHASASFYLGMIDLHAGNFRAAINYFNDAEKNQFSDPTLFIMRGIAYQKIGEINRSINEYSLSLSKDSANWLAYYNRASLHLLSGNWDVALKDLDKVLELNPSHYEALCIRGMYLFGIGDFGLALGDLEKGIIGFESNSLLLYNLGYCYLRLGMYEQGKDTFEKLILKFPKNAAAYRGLAVIHLKRNNISECIKMLTRCELLDLNEFLKTNTDPDFKELMNNQQYLLLMAQAKAKLGRKYKRIEPRK